MFSAGYGIGRFHGAEIVLVLLALFHVILLAGSMVFRCNRCPEGRKRLLFGTVLVSAICDAVLFLMMYPAGEYCNRGIGSVFGILCYPVILLVTAAVLTALNYE